jgi:hypothetical protein
VLVVLDGPRRDQRIDLGLPVVAQRGRLVARVADQILAADDLEEALPMLGIGAAGVDVDVVVRAAALALEDAARRIATGYRLIARPLTGPPLRAWVANASRM